MPAKSFMSPSTSFTWVTPAGSQRTSPGRPPLAGLVQPAPAVVWALPSVTRRMSPDAPRSIDIEFCSPGAAV